jgi:DNA-binding MarR family transcriptional regulator
MSPSQLQQTLIVTSGGMSNLLKKAEDMGLIERHEDPLDGRGRIVQLTQKALS